MFSKIYNLYMWIIEILKLVLKLSPEMRSMGFMALVLSGGAYYTSDYVNAKHIEVTEKIKKSEDQIQQVISAQSVLLIEMKSVSESMKDVKDSVKGMEDKVWQIGRDVYMIKNKNGG